MFDIITFGSAVIDVFVGTNVAEKKNFISYPAGAKILIKDLKFDVGGGGTNTAAAFSRLGFKTGCICKIGNDNNGKEILDLLKKEEIEFLGKIDKNEKSGYSVILDSRGGERTILTYKGANDEINLNEIDSNKIKSSWIYYSALMGKSFETQKKLAEILVKRGCRLAFNPSSYLIKNKNLSSLLKLCEILILNKEEAKMLTHEKDLLIGLHKLGPKIVVITDKDRLISCFDGEKKYFLKPHKIKIVERTGAGDAFASGFVAGYMIKWNLQKCLELGLKESESVIRYFGAKNKLLRMKLKK